MTVRHAWKVTIAVVLMIFLIIAGVLANIFYTNSVVHELCTVINTTVSSPVPAGANAHNPARLSELRIHNEFVALQREYSC